MLINRVREKHDGMVQEKEILEVDDNLGEYHTAHELFDIMAKNHPHNLDVFDSKTFKQRDLVILYENIDLGTKLMSVNNDTRNEAFIKAPNQYVETIIYNDDLESEDSDIYEIYSNEDLRNVFAVNNERIDLLGNIPSFENTLCHKFGNIHMKKSDFSNKNHYLFKDSYIKEQLQSFHAMTNSKQSDSSVLPTSLLDYICSKRLDDNYNFYMDNVISYVQNTIEQLKRISNGDYLTERVKEKWREVENSFNNNTNNNDNVIALSRTRNVPLPLVGKISALKSTWDEIVHSEMDVRCLTKLLEKKIIMEVPKILCGSYGFLSKNFKDNLTLSCSKVKNLIIDEVKERNADVVILKLQKPETGLVIPNDDSIIVLKTLAPSIENDSTQNTIFTLHLNEVYSNKEKPKIVELEDNEKEITEKNDTPNNQMAVVEETSQNLWPYTVHEINEGLNLIPTDELGYAIRQLNIQSSVLEESEVCYSKKKKSPTRVRIKSPYENKSHILDERKRRKLLEIREKREKKKLAMNENCKITKHKYVKGAVMAQSSNSVTKLSITNKSFYNSIYGQANTINKDYRNIIKEEKQNNIPGIDIQECEEELKKESSIISPGKDSLKYINRSYYLDDADTEITHLQLKPNCDQDDINEILTPSTSILSSDAGNFTSIKNLISPSTTDLSGTDTSSLQQNILLEDVTESSNIYNQYQTTTPNLKIVVPSDTIHENSSKNEEYKKVTASVECRKSIDKIYDLMNKITVSPITNDGKKVCEFVNINNSMGKTRIRLNDENTNLRPSDSDNSLKLQIISSNLSICCIEKEIPAAKAPRKPMSKRTETSTAVIPKVVINSKLQNEGENKTKKENRKVEFKVVDNPLKAISQLLHEFDNVQKSRYMNGKDKKLLKKPENITVGYNSARQLANKIASHGAKNSKPTEQANTRYLKPLSPTKTLTFSKQTSREVKPVHKKKLADIIDEVKELKGEAVRGPPKRSSRIDNLAQPKKSYIQTHHEDFLNRHSKNITPRMQKFSTIQEKTTRINYKNRQREGIETSSNVAKQSCIVASSLEKTVKTKRSANSSPVGKDKPVPANKLPKTMDNDPDSLKKKMVVVENYLKSHFGQISATCEVGEKVQNITRVPLIPNDIDIASMTSSPVAEESTTLGNKLQNMINSKINTNTLPLSTSTENNSFKIKMENDDRVESVEFSMKSDTTSSISEHPVDIFEDKNIITAVACISNENNKNKLETELNANMFSHEVQEFEPCNEVLKLENALYHQLSKGVFQKRLRMKNLTLTPKQSLQHMFVLQSNDAKSLIVKSTLSQNLNVSKSDTISKLNILPVISRKAVNFNLPLQITTVGYVLPTYQALSNNNNKKNILDNKNVDNNFHSITTKNNECVDKCVQCYKGHNERQSLKQNVDTKGTDMLTMNTVCTEALSEISNLIIDNQVTTPSNEKIIAEAQLLNDAYKSQNEITIKSEDKIRKSSENISNCTSLDILVGLLNEIRKITTCQSDFPSSNEAGNISESKKLKVFLNDTTAPDSAASHSVKCSISISSLDSKTQKHPSNFSLHIQSHTEDHINYFKSIKDNKTIENMTYVEPFHSDKEINVHISPNEYVNKCTDVPSRLFPITVNRSTNVVKSLIAIVKKNSSKPYSNNINVLYSNSTFNNVNLLPSINNQISFASLKPDDEKIQEIVTKRNVLQSIMITTGEKVKPERNAGPEKNIPHTNNFNTFQEFDSLLKMKRDILVTVYSILVLTVFAALTMPEIIFPV